MVERQAQTINEVSIRDIFLKLWRRRWVLVTVPIIVAALGFCVALLSAVRIKNEVIHFVALTGIENGNYASGVEFSPSDITSPAILNELALKFDIRDLKALRAAINVRYGSPVSLGISTKYTKRLSAKGLKAAEAEVINSQFEDELERATKNGVIITVDYEALKISESQGVQLALALPIIWEKEFGKRFQVFDGLDLSVANKTKQLVLATPIGALDATKRLQEIERTLELMSQHQRMSGLLTRKGNTTSELQRRVVQIQNLYVDKVLSSYLADNDPFTKYYQNGLYLEIQRITEKIEATNSSIRSIQAVMGGATSGMSDDQKREFYHFQSPVNTVDDIAALVNKAELADFIKELHSIKLSLVSERADINFIVNKLNLPVAVDKKFVSNAETNIGEFLDEYFEIVFAGKEMLRSDSAVLSQNFGYPATPKISLDLQSWAMILIAMIASVILTAIIILIWPTHNKRAQESLNH